MLFTITGEFICGVNLGFVLSQTDDRLWQILFIFICLPPLGEARRGFNPKSDFKTPLYFLGFSPTPPTLPTLPSLISKRGN